MIQASFEFVGKTRSLTSTSKYRMTQEIVAVKITEVDSTDYKEYFEDKDRSLPDLIREINVLQQLKESKAKEYVNIIYEAFSMHSELWIVSEYCPGGSVLTLMKPTPKGLAECYIVAIARELAFALKFVHEAGVLHRDVKCESSVFCNPREATDRRNSKAETSL